MRNMLWGSAGVAALMLVAGPHDADARSAADKQQDAVEFEYIEPREAAPVSPGQNSFEDNEKNGNAERAFSYAWPEAVEAHPKLVTLMNEMREDALTDQKSEWNEAVAEFGTNGCITCTVRDYSVTWQTVTDTPRFLSLSAGIYVYGGGAHGNSFFDTLVWDRKADAPVSPKALFKSDSALWSAIEAPYCKALNKERAERRGGPVKEGDYGSECPKLDELVLLVGSSNGTTFDRLGLLAAPYVAGSYAEGPYEVTLPVTADVVSAVLSPYREYFSLGS